MLTTIAQLETLAAVAREGRIEGRWFPTRSYGTVMQFPRQSILNKLRKARLVGFVEAAQPYVYVTPKGLEYLDYMYERLFPELARAVTALHKAELLAIEAAMPLKEEQGYICGGNRLCAPRILNENDHHITCLGHPAYNGKT